MRPNKKYFKLLLRNINSVKIQLWNGFKSL